MNRTLLIPLDRCLVEAGGSTSAGHCAAGWYWFVLGGGQHDVTKIDSSVGPVGYLPLRKIFRANDARDHATVIRLFAAHGIDARYVETATDEQILAAWRGEPDSIDIEFNQLIANETETVKA